MTPGLLHHYIHELLHFLSGCVGAFGGTWAYFTLIQKRKKQPIPSRDEFGANWRPVSCRALIGVICLHPR